MQGFQAFSGSLLYPLPRNIALERVGSALVAGQIFDCIRMPRHGSLELWGSLLAAVLDEAQAFLFDIGRSVTEAGFKGIDGCVDVVGLVADHLDGLIQEIDCTKRRLGQSY
jgi:hypothetical protein